MIPSVYEIRKDIEALADVIAAAVVKRQRPNDDLVTLRELHREFGRTWVDRHIAAGTFVGMRTGTNRNARKKFSRMEAISQLEAERQHKVLVVSKFSTTQEDTKS